jgi:hypothetical protein
MNNGCGAASWNDGRMLMRRSWIGPRYKGSVIRFETRRRCGHDGAGSRRSERRGRWPCGTSKSRPRRATHGRPGRTGRAVSGGIETMVSHPSRGPNSVRSSPRASCFLGVSRRSRGYLRIRSERPHFGGRFFEDPRAGALAKPPIIGPPCGQRGTHRSSRLRIAPVLDRSPRTRVESSVVLAFFWCEIGVVVGPITTQLAATGREIRGRPVDARAGAADITLWVGP